MTINEMQDQLITDISLLGDPTSQQQYITSLGQSLPLLEAKYKQAHYQVKDWCTSIWVNAVCIKDKVWFSAEGEDAESKGLLGMFIRVLSGNHPKDIADADLYFMHEIASLQILQPFFNNHWPLIVRKMKSIAVAFQLQLLMAGPEVTS